MASSPQQQHLPPNPLYMSSWDSTFTTRRDNLCYPDLNKSYVSLKRDQRQTVQEAPRRLFDRPTLQQDENTVWLFMRCDQDNPCDYKTDFVTGFCGNVSLSDFKQKKTVALLDDSDGSGNTRSNHYALTASQLHQELQKKRFDRLNFDHIDANIRRLYITNLDACSILALADTASEHEASVLRSFIYDHLKCHASISATNNLCGLSTFTLEFHLPFFALRKSQRASVDLRKKPDGTPLRESIALRPAGARGRMPFQPADQVDYIYEAQLSCVVTGFSHYVWSAYLFLDIYHEEESIIDQTVDEYEEDSETGPSPFRPDSLTCGKTAGDRFDQSPREYFLKILEIRINPIKSEWHNTFAYIEQRVKSHNAVPYWMRTGGNPASKKWSSPLMTSERLECNEWRSEITRLAKRLLQPLSSTIDEWDHFIVEGDASYFSEDGNTAALSKKSATSFHAIRRTMREMRSIRDKFNRLIEGLEKEQSLLETSLALEASQFAVLQQNTARNVQVLTWTTFAFLPLSLAAALMSTQPGAMPGIPSPKSFAICFAVLEALSVILLGVLWKWEPGFIANFFGRVYSIFSGSQKEQEHLGA